MGVEVGIADKKSVSNFETDFLSAIPTSTPTFRYPSRPLHVVRHQLQEKVHKLGRKQRSERRTVRAAASTEVTTIQVKRRLWRLPDRPCDRCDVDCGSACWKAGVENSRPKATED